MRVDWGLLCWSVNAACALGTGWVCGRALADEPQEVAVWYRSGQGCPDGEAFVRVLQERAVKARLAKVGDAIDFVVTLGADGAGSSGVLERQTATGNVAIRRVNDPSCERVAEALSLTLALALQADAASASTAVPEDGPAAAPAVVAPSEPLAPERSARATTSRSSPPASSGSEPAAAAQPRLGVSILGSAVTGIAPGILWGAVPAAELELGSGVLRPSLRLGGSLQLGSGTRAGFAFDVRILAGRFELCPIELRTAAVAARPCAAIELGQLQGEGAGNGGRSERGLWGASELGVRANWPARGAFALEAQLGLQVPLTRYTLTAGAQAEVVQRTASVCGVARIGASVHFW